jgi:hypothetical protein
MSRRPKMDDLCGNCGFKYEDHSPIYEFMLCPTSTLWVEKYDG